MPDEQKQIEKWDPDAWPLVFTYYQQDLTTYWTRSNFFLVMHGILFGFAANMANSDTGRWLLITSAVVGFSLAVLWLLVLLSSYAWIGAWRSVLAEADEQSAERQPAVIQRTIKLLRDKPEAAWIWSRWTGAGRPAVLSQWAPVIFAAGWAAMFALAL